jgi:3-oxoacyl-[acyl-carrier-protein] synthase II
MVTPLGLGVSHVWSQLLAGRSGIRTVSGFDADDLPTRYAGQVPHGKAPGEFDIEALFDVQERRRFEPFVQFATVAVAEAVRDAGWENPGELERDSSRCATASAGRATRSSPRARPEPTPSATPGASSRSAMQTS